MRLFNQLNYYINIILIIAVSFAIIMGLLFLYFAKFRKKRKDVEKDELYSTFDRKNAKSYVPADDVDSDMIRVGNTYIAAIKCKGIDYFDAHEAEQFAINSGYLGFVNVIDRPIQKRICSKKVDLEDTIDNHKKVLDSLQKKIYDTYNDFTKYEKNMKNASEDERVLYMNELHKLNNKLDNLQIQKDHIENIIYYLNEISGENAQPITEDTYLFEWNFDPKKFPEGITEKEIKERANKELETYANTLIKALSSALVKTTRVKSNELDEMIRRHNHPWGVDIYKQSDIENSNFDELVVTSRSMEVARKRYEAAAEKLFFEELDYQDYEVEIVDEEYKLDFLHGSTNDNTQILGGGLDA